MSTSTDILNIDSPLANYFCNLRICNQKIILKPCKVLRGFVLEINNIQSSIMIEAEAPEYSPYRIMTL